MYNGHKVTVKAKHSYVDQKDYPPFDGTVMETMRDQYGTITGLYILSIDERGCGMVAHVPMQEVIFHDGARLQKDLDSMRTDNKDLYAQTLGMMLGGIQPMEV